MNESRCDNCLRIFHTAELGKIKDVRERVASGEPMPSGECKKCGGLCHRFAEYTDSELIILDFFARGFIAKAADRPGGVDIDEWHSPYEGLDIHFQTCDDVEDADYGKILAWGYHRDKFKDGDCVDEIRLEAEGAGKPVRDIPNSLSIGMYLHCGLCLGDGHPQEIEAGWTELGLQVWCKYHKANILHVDFQGSKLKANTSANLETAENLPKGLEEPKIG